MYIQKKGNAYYYRESIWNADTKKRDSICTYLGSNTINAINKLKTIIEDKDNFNMLVAKIYAFNMPTLTELLDSTITTIENAIRQARSLGDDELQTILYEAECNLRTHKSRTKDK